MLGAVGIDGHGIYDEYSIKQADDSRRKQCYIVEKRQQKVYLDIVQGM